ncbi:hypothetical protein R0K04_30555, partial [Pseudoalteromonas sp. SIMBA_153]
FALALLPLAFELLFVLLGGLGVGTTGGFLLVEFSAGAAGFLFSGAGLLALFSSFGDASDIVFVSPPTVRSSLTDN